MLGAAGLLIALISIGFILWSRGAPYLDQLVDHVPTEEGLPTAMSRMGVSDGELNGDGRMPAPTLAPSSASTPLVTVSGRIQSSKGTGVAAQLLLVPFRSRRGGFVEATSGPDGEFKFPWASNDRVVAAVARVGGSIQLERVEIQHTDRGARLTPITLSDVFQCEVRVVDERGEGVAGATLSLGLPHLDRFRFEEAGQGWRRQLSVGVTDEQGHCYTRGLASGRGQLVVSAEGYSPCEVSIPDLMGHGHELEVVLARGSILQHHAPALAASAGWIIEAVEPPHGGLHEGAVGQLVQLASIRPCAQCRAWSGATFKLTLSAHAFPVLIARRVARDVGGSQSTLVSSYIAKRAGYGPWTPLAETEIHIGSWPDPEAAIDVERLDLRTTTTGGTKVGLEGRATRPSVFSTGYCMLGANTRVVAVVGSELMGTVEVELHPGPNAVSLDRPASVTIEIALRSTDGAALPGRELTVCAPDWFLATRPTTDSAGRVSLTLPRHTRFSVSLPGQRFLEHGETAQLRAREADRAVELVVRPDVAALEVTVDDDGLDGPVRVGVAPSASRRQTHWRPLQIKLADGKEWASTKRRGDEVAAAIVQPGATVSFPSLPPGEYTAYVMEPSFEGETVNSLSLLGSPRRAKVRLTAGTTSRVIVRGTPKERYQLILLEDDGGVMRPSEGQVDLVVPVIERAEGSCAAQDLQVPLQALGQGRYAGDLEPDSHYLVRVVDGRGFPSFTVVRTEIHSADIELRLNHVLELQLEGGTPEAPIMLQAEVLPLDSGAHGWDGVSGAKFAGEIEAMEGTVRILTLGHPSQYTLQLRSGDAAASRVLRPWIGGDAATEPAPDRAEFFVPLR